MNTHDKIELPPLPKGDIAADTCPVMWVHSNEQLQEYARSAIKADRQQRGEPYNYKRIGWELERTAMGDGFYGNALRAAKDILGVSGEDRDVLDRYATGTQRDTDHIALQNIARNIYMTPQPAEPEKQETMTASELADRVARGEKWKVAEPVKVPSDLPHALRDLVAIWRKQQGEYPAEGKQAAAAVRLCANELELLLARYGQSAPKFGEKE